jgi:hypothetical protein
MYCIPGGGNQKFIEIHSQRQLDEINELYGSDPPS